MRKLEDIREHKPVILARYCPVCGHTVTQMSVDLALRDYHCPGCEETRLSDFIGIRGWKHDIRPDSR
jgi:hypothetical protein